MAYTTIDDPTLYFSTTLWSGNGTDDRDIVVDGTGMQPDWVWIKERSSTGFHFTFDSVRGATKNLHTNSTQAESTQANALQTFNSNGFQIGNDSDINNSGDTYVSWNWLAGGTASSNTDGSITSNVSANTTAGFSIVSYTGTGSAGTIGHGLGATPSMIILKKRSGSANWMIWHQALDLTDGQFMEFNNKQEQSSGTAVWDVSEMSSTNIGIGTNGDSNGSSATYIAYCFAEKKGYSKIGSYTGNGNADGAFVYTGFKPSWLMYKRTDTTGSWEMWDNKRSTFNPENKALFANTSDAEATASNLDFTSNGFKIRVSSAGINASGGSYIYMCFSENPFVTSTGIPTTAR